MLDNARKNVEQEKKSTVFGYYVDDSERYGIATFDSQGNVTSIEEEQNNPKSNYAVVGLYFYPNSVIKVAKNIEPSARRELEITTVNQEYLKKGNFSLELMGRGYAWLDTGIHESLLDVSEFISTIE